MKNQIQKEIKPLFFQTNQDPISDGHQNEIEHLWLFCRKLITLHIGIAILGVVLYSLRGNTFCEVVNVYSLMISLIGLIANYFWMTRIIGLYALVNSNSILIVFELFFWFFVDILIYRPLSLRNIRKFNQTHLFIKQDLTMIGLALADFVYLISGLKNFQLCIYVFTQRDLNITKKNGKLYFRRSIQNVMSDKYEKKQEEQDEQEETDIELQSNDNYVIKNDQQNETDQDIQLEQYK